MKSWVGDRENVIVFSMKVCILSMLYLNAIISCCSYYNQVILVGDQFNLNFILIYRISGISVWL